MLIPPPSPPGLSAKHPNRRVPRRAHSAWQAGALFVALMLASASYSLDEHWIVSPFEPSVAWLYQAATLAFNYFDLGAVRRGLGGSVAALLSDDAYAAAIRFHFLFAGATAAAAAWLVWRLRADPTTRTVFALLFFVLMYRWGDPLGGGGARPDLAVAFLFGLATLAFSRGRAALAALMVGIGLFVHETSFIFGVPLLAALVLQSGGWSRVPAAQRRAGVAILLAALVLYAGLGLLPHADLRTAVDTVRGRFSRNDYVDWAIYFAVSGWRGVSTSMCQNRFDPTYSWHVLGGLGVIAAFAVATGAHSPRHRRVAMLAALPGYVFLAVVANDFSRWTLLAALNVWLVGVVRPDRTPPARRGAAFMLACALLTVPLVLYKASRAPLRVYSPSPLFEAALRRVHDVSTPNVQEALDRCDPRWREVLDPR